MSKGEGMVRAVAQAKGIMSTSKTKWALSGEAWWIACVRGVVSKSDSHKGMFLFPMSKRHLEVSLETCLACSPVPSALYTSLMFYGLSAMRHVARR